MHGISPAQPLPEALRTGLPQNEVKYCETNVFEALYADLAKLEPSLGAMTGILRVNFEALADTFDFSKYKSLCDVGGATGLLCIEAARKHAHLTCTSFDLPPVVTSCSGVKGILNAGYTDRMAKPVIRVSDVEAAADFAAVLTRVRAGTDVVIEHGATPVAVVHPARPVRRTIEECIALLPSDSSGTVDADFEDDVAVAVASHPESLTPPAWD